MELTNEVHPALPLALTHAVGFIYASLFLQVYSVLFLSMRSYQKLRFWADLSLRGKLTSPCFLSGMIHGKRPQARARWSMLTTATRKNPQTMER